MPVVRLLRRILAGLANVGADPADSEELGLRKALLVSGSTMFVFAGVAWGLLYMAFGELRAGVIPLGYAVISLASLILFARTRRFVVYRFSQLVLILVLPFLLMTSLGGFVNSSAVILWSLLCPLGALLFDEPRRAPLWFLAYAALVALSAVIQPYARVSNNLPWALIVALFALNLVAVSSIAFTLMYSFVRQKDLALSLLRIEQGKSEGLLLNILPKEIAAILKNETRTIVDHFDAASILFADMVGFTPRTAQMEPTEMLALLNEVFSHFDALVEKYDLEKIRTIGDSYMVASGVPRVRADHAQALARMALDMLTYLRTDPHCARRGVQFRIGMHSGPVVAGVIGRKKFIYDLWGDAVNTASRMESHGLPGKIQFSRETYELLKAEFICEPRGEVEIKGKGLMRTWILVGPRPVGVVK
jgi:guanylate cyclase